MVGIRGQEKQLILFLTGPGGSSKSKVIKTLLDYRQQYSSTIKQPFTEQTILVTACSGVAATLINCQTLHSATFLNSEKKSIKDETRVKFRNVDEISMLQTHELKKLNKNMNWLKEKPTAKYGGVDIAFMGDFRQLPPVGYPPIYEKKPYEFCGYVNTFIELNGKYRFKHDRPFGELCWRFNRGLPTDDDFDTINSRVVSEHNPLPKNIRAACKTNAEREAINVGTWLQYLQEHGEAQGLVILADKFGILPKNYPTQPLQDMHTFYTEVGEDDCDAHERTLRPYVEVLL